MENIPGSTQHVLNEKQIMKEILSAWLMLSRQLNFTVIIAGRISGGVFEDAFHKPVAYEVDNEKFVIHFEREESLSVFHPANATLGADALLIVKDANEARFTWYLYGQPHAPEFLCEDIYHNAGRFASFQRTVPRAIPPGILDPFPTWTPLPTDPFIKLVSGQS